MGNIRKRQIGGDARNVRWDAITEVTGEGGKRSRRVKTFYTQKEAKDYLHAARDAQPSLSKPFADLKDNFLAYYEGLVGVGKREASTLKQLREYFKVHIIPDREFSDRKTGEISAEVVQLFLDRLQLRVSQAMAVKVKATLSQVLGYGAGRGFLTFNPAKDAKIATSNRPEIDDDVEPFTLPTKAQLSRLLATARGYDNTGKAEATVRLLMFAGLRISEVRGERWSDCVLDGQHPSVTVNQKADLAGKIGKVKTEASKREIGIGPATVAALMRWREAAPDGAYIFSNEVGKPYSYANLWNRFWIPLMNMAGLVTEKDASKAVRKWSKAQSDYKEPAFGFHMLRHVYASLQIEKGVTSKRLQKLMGHSTLKLTMDTYGHLWPDQAGEQVRAEAIELMFARS